MAGRSQQNARERILKNFDVGKVRMTQRLSQLQTALKPSAELAAHGGTNGGERDERPPVQRNAGEGAGRHDEQVHSPSAERGESSQASANRRSPPASARAPAGFVQPSNGASNAAKPPPNKPNGTAQKTHGPLNMDWLNDEEYMATLLAKK
ncbi:hypothetical protein M3Y99_00614800 [Aphelenchoides fujianensis]|nr:hypothetical protein M3Y99_00614800 [Aphelenchoides fujianensis]